MFTRALILTLALIALPAFAAEEFLGTYVRFTGTGTSDNDVLFTTSDMDRWDACLLMSSAGAVDVLVSLDGSAYSTAPLSLQDFGSTDMNPVLVTTTGRVYGFVGKFKYIKVLQNGATAATAAMNCWKQGA